MSWVNLDDVYVNKTGDSIAGNLSVGGTLTINNAKGNGGTYNVANEITTLRDSVSHVPKIYIGSLVKQSSDTAVCMFTNNEFISKFGRSFDHTTDFIDVINGDCNKIPVHVEGTQLDPIEKNVWAVFDRVWNSSIRLNYIVALA